MLNWRPYMIATQTSACYRADVTCTRRHATWRWIAALVMTASGSASYVSGVPSLDGDSATGADAAAGCVAVQS